MDDFTFRSLPKFAEDKRKRKRDRGEYYALDGKLKPAVSTSICSVYTWSVDRMSEKSREASDMLAAAIQQMDGILAGQSFQELFIL